MRLFRCSVATSLFPWYKKITGSDTNRKEWEVVANCRVSYSSILAYFCEGLIGSVILSDLLSEERARGIVLYCLFCLISLIRTSDSEATERARGIVFYCLFRREYRCSPSLGERLKLQAPLKQEEPLSNNTDCTLNFLNQNFINF